MHRESGHTVTEIVSRLRAILSDRPEIRLALLFGSIATGTATSESDLGIAVSTARPMTAQARLSLMDELALAFGRPVDLVDLAVTGEPLLGQILAHGVRVLGDSSVYGDLLYRHLVDAADFLPYRKRILAERRKLWVAR